MRSGEDLGEQVRDLVRAEVGSLSKVLDVLYSPTRADSIS
jgi:hypothetical protein